MSTNASDEHVVQVKEKKFAVMEVFGPTIQGEGSVIGMQTMFVRFGGCDYRCTKCDSLHAVLPELIKRNGVKMTANEIWQDTRNLAGHCRMVTFSGGNPCMWDLSELVKLFREDGWIIAVETQGTLWQDWLRDCHYVTVSPKGPGMGEQFENDKFKVFYDLLNYWSLTHFVAKIVIMDQRDIEFAKAFACEWPNVKLYLSLGNPWPPKPAEQAPAVYDCSLSDALLGRMKILWEEIKKEEYLKNAIFLPQLHTLLWGAEKGR